MKHFIFKPEHVCSTKMDIYLSDDKKIIKEIKITGGCPGNTVGVSRLAANRNIDEAIGLLEGIDCRMRGTSCPDQLAHALIQIKNGELKEVA